MQQITTAPTRSTWTRFATPGERCRCGRPATIVYNTASGPRPACDGPALAIDCPDHGQARVLTHGPAGERYLVDR